MTAIARFTFLRRVCLRCLIILGMAFACTQTWAQASAPAGAGSSAATSTTAAVGGKAGDYGTGAASAQKQIASLLNNLIPAAVAASQTVVPEANKFAWGLGVITLVLAGLRFAGTHHPVSAWVSLFEEVAVLGIFAALYLGYSGTAHIFWDWFANLAKAIEGSSPDPGSQMAKLGGTILDALRTRLSASGAILNFVQVAADALVLLLAFIVMTVASIVFTYYTSIGMIQSAIGIVLGPIGVALGFSSYTRGYFQKWLDWMISSGMYVVVVAVLMKLVGQSISTSVATASNVGAESTMNAAFVFDLSIFVLLLSFEIPKLASIFGGGASASGGGGLRMATKAAKGAAGLFL
jgi:TrbL/VirB6 plasmid conjugal transfer protein